MTQALEPIMPHPPTPRPRWAGRLSLACALLLSISACGGDEEAGSSGEVLEISADAVEILGTSDDLTRVRDLEIDADGTIWVLDDEPPFFVGFDPSGEVVATVGMRGQGPQGFQNPDRLLRIEGDDPSADGIWIFDQPRHAFLRLTAPGRSVEEAHGTGPVPFPQEDVPVRSLLSGVGGMPVTESWFGPAGGSALAAHAPGESPISPAFWRARIVELDLADGSLRERWDMRDFLDDPEAHHPGATELMPVPLWAACPDGSAWFYDPASNRVRPLPVEEGAGAGSPSTPEAIELTPERLVALTLERMAALFLPIFIDEVPSSERPPDDQLRVLFDAEFGPMIDESFASIFPEYYQMQCSTDSTLWLQWFDWNEGLGGQGRRWTRITRGSEDATLEAVRFPEGFHAMRFEAEGAWGIVQDAFDLPSVAFVTVP